MPTSAGEASSEPSIQFQLVHAVRGRTRLRVTPADRTDELARAFARLLRDQPGVREVRSNADSGSIVVTYDPDQLDVERLFSGSSPGAAVASWSLNPLGAAREMLAGWLAIARDAGNDALERATDAWGAGRDQINAVISFWSANSVVARSRTLLQRASGSLRGAAIGSRK